MSWKNIRLIFLRELRDQLRDRRTLFMITILPVLLYPMLGLGLVEMMLTFSEERRTIVILNASQLPDSPPLLDEQGIRTSWYSEGQTDADKLRVITDRGFTATAVSDVSQHDENTKADSASSQSEDHKSDGALIATARQLADKLHLLQKLEYEEYLNTKESQTADGQTQEDSPPDAGKRQAGSDSQPSGLTEIIGIREQISQMFLVSGIDVLTVVPQGYSDTLSVVRQQVQDRNSESEDAFLAPVLVVRNSADDKSASAFARVTSAFKNWEDAIRASFFADASLPQMLQNPARLRWVEVAKQEQVSASVWSKMFPAMLVIMALTGAFYPAIDLGAGEKERGTMETLLISPAKRVELVLGKFATVMLFSVCTALLNLLSMGITGQHMAMAMGSGTPGSLSLDFPGISSLLWVIVLLFPLAALFSALCLALATFARSTKEGQYYLTPLLMAVMGVTMFCLFPAIEMTPLYSVLPVVNVAVLLKGLLLTSGQSSQLAVYAIPVLVSSIGYSMLALWWAIELYNSEDVLFREAEKFDLRLWMRQILRTKDAVPAFPEAIFCFVLILMLQFVAMSSMQPDLSDNGSAADLMKIIVTQQLVMIACPAVFMGVLLTTSLKATFRLRKPSLHALGLGMGLAMVIHPLSVELSQFLVSHRVFPPIPEGAARVMGMLKSDQQPVWLLLVVFALTPAICEELAFRGFVLSGLARGGRLAISVVISSMMFGIIHMIPQQAFNAGLLGLVLALLAIYSRSIFPSMAFHFVNNSIATLHAGGLKFLYADGVFFSRDAENSLRYESPLLILCGVAAFLMILHMVRIVIREQDHKRRGIIPAFGESAPHAATLSRMS